MTAPDSITVEVAYARPDKQKIMSVNVPQGATAMEAVLVSGIINEFPEIDLNDAKMGLFGKHLGTKGMAGPDDYVLKPKDRVEIYRPLLVDPKEVRRKRAEKKKREQENKNEGAGESGSES